MYLSASGDMTKAHRLSSYCGEHYETYLNNGVKCALAPSRAASSLCRPKAKQRLIDDNYFCFQCFCLIDRNCIYTAAALYCATGTITQRSNGSTTSPRLVWHTVGLPSVSRLPIHYFFTACYSRFALDCSSVIHCKDESSSSSSNCNDADADGECWLMMMMMVMTTIATALQLV